MNIKDLIAKRKAAIIAAADNVSDETINELAEAELAEDTIKQIGEICTNLDKMLKASGVSRDWSTPPKYEYGSVNGMIGKFVTQWVYLPDALKQLSGLNVPVTAFTQESANNWGKLARCTPLGTITEQIMPNLGDVNVQIEMCKVYLNLAYTEPCLTETEWLAKAEAAKTRAEGKAANIAAALVEAEQASLLGLPSFTV